MDFSSIKKFEESGSTLRKDSSAPELYGSMPIRPNIEMSPEVNSKKMKSREVRKDEPVNISDDMSRYSDEKRSTLPLHSESFKKHSDKKEYIYHEDREIVDTEKRHQYKESPAQSPHFMKDTQLSASNPFLP